MPSGCSSRHHDGENPAPPSLKRGSCPRHNSFSVTNSIWPNVSLGCVKIVGPGSTSSPSGKKPPPGLAIRTPLMRSWWNSGVRSSSSTYHASEWKCWPNRPRNFGNGTCWSSGSLLGSMTSIMKSPIIDSVAHRFSRSAKPLGWKSCGENIASNHALVSSMSSTTWMRWKNSRIGIATSSVWDRARRRRLAPCCPARTSTPAGRPR